MDHFCYLYFVAVCHTVLSAHCSLVVTFWEGADLLALLHLTSCVFVTFPYCALGSVRYLIFFLFLNFALFLTFLSANKFPFHRFAGYDVQHIHSSIFNVY